MKVAQGSLVSVNVSKEKGTVKTPRPEIHIGPQGVEGDAHAGPWHRQVSLLSSESIAKFSAQAKQDFGPGEFAENLTTQGLDLSGVAVLDRLVSGAIELEVTQLGKQCHGDGCAIYREVGRCVMPKEGIFCRVIQGGKLRPGDGIEHHPRPLRIWAVTLSDRASQGLYEDRSGPRMVALVEQYLAPRRWHLAIETRILPDDATLLRQTLLDAREKGVDAVFTSGGTGIGPRDHTPDVVLALADKTLPGIMDYIRMKYGQDKPAALLSRSVAAVLGGTLVYTLPGSPRAVEEYLAEILKTFEHLLRTLHEIDGHD